MNHIEKAIERVRTADRESSSPGGAYSDPGGVEAQNVSVAERLNLDLEGLRGQGFITPDVPRSQSAEEYRLIKRPLLKRALNREVASSNERSNLIMVTSALMGEGKTFTAFNLAMSVVMEYDHTVLLVDADVVKPHLTRILGLEDRQGLVDVLLNPELDLSSAMIQTDIPNLRVVSAGQFHSRSTELLASRQMDRLAEEISRRYPERIIIFDTSPLLATTQPSVLTHVLGQIVLVVEAGHTPQRAIKEAVSFIDRSRPVWMLLNKSSGGFGTGYGRYSYYGYG